MSIHLRRPVELLTALSRRWPNPIEAAIKLRVGPSTHWPLPLLQLGFMVRRASRFLMRNHSQRKRFAGEAPFELHLAG
jgi:hypothetical protein